MIRVISLDDSPNKKRFDKRYKKFSYSYFDAIKGSVHKNEFDIEFFKYKYAREPRDGEIGCTLSHFFLFLELSNSINSEYLIILEDDAIPEDVFFDFIKKLEVQNDIPACYLLGHSKTNKKNLFFQRMKQPLCNKVNLSGLYFGKNNRLSYCGTVGYIINKKAAECIANFKKPYWLADDWSLFSSLGINIYHPVSPVIYEDLNTDSSTANLIEVNHNWKKEPITQMLSILRSRFIFKLLRNER